MVKFVVPLPVDQKATEALKKQRKYMYGNPPEAARKDWVAKETRRRWRCLLITIKAKLECIETGIETFEEAFLAHIVTETGQTIYQRLQTDPKVKLLGPAKSSAENVIDINEVRK